MLLILHRSIINPQWFAYTHSPSRELGSGLSWPKHMWILRSKSASSQLMHDDMRLPRVGHDLARYDHESTRYDYTIALHIPIEFNGAAPGDDPCDDPSVITNPSLGSYNILIELLTMCVVLVWYL